MRKCKFFVSSFMSVVSDVFMLAFGVVSAQAELQSHDIEAARKRMSRRVTHEQRKAVADRMAKTNPALADRIAQNRAALIRARDSRVSELKTRNVTNISDANTARRVR